jgi:hypothetical protein
VKEGEGVMMSSMSTNKLMVHLVLEELIDTHETHQLAAGTWYRVLPMNVQYQNESIVFWLVCLIALRFGVVGNSPLSQPLQYQFEGQRL